MSTYIVKLEWEFIVEADTVDLAKLAVANLTDHFFQEMVRFPEFSCENITAELVDGMGAGVDAGL